MARQKTPAEILRLLNSSRPERRALGYEYFLGRTHWVKGSTPDDLKKLACMLLFLDPGRVRANPPVLLSPERLWASQTELEREKVDMVEAVHRYILTTGEEFPPIIVWDFFEKRQMRYVVHDGHHRCYFCHQRDTMVSSVIMEPLGTYREAEAKLDYAFRIKTRVINLPIL